MKTKTLISVVTFILTVLLISSCATSTKTKEEREVVQPEIFFQSVRSGDYTEVKR
ncbi:hypothetical protein LCGC14_2436520, partial [marine sediment metagenome]